ncbi:MAG: DUF1467 family protein [Rhodobacteraceae bacterium]|nr:DUF1467 family protein [Paracoccaceae bacterium]
MFITLQITTCTQGDEGDVVPGTHAGAPAKFKLKRSMIIVSLITVSLCAVICGVIISGTNTIEF